MKAVMLLAAAVALAGGAAFAEPNEGPTTTICLDVIGHQQPVTCHSMSASRLNRAADICQCLHGGQQVTVDVCPAGVRAPAENAAYERERLRMVQHGSLVGQTWRGQPVCVAPHRGA